MKSAFLQWLTPEDVNQAKKWRHKSIEAAREIIVKQQKYIEKLEEELYQIEISEKVNVVADIDVENPVLENESRTINAKKPYSTKWSWYEKAVYVLQETKTAGTAMEIAVYLSGYVEPGMRGNQEKLRKAQAAIINAMKPRVKSGIIVVVKTEKDVLKYGLGEWAGNKLLGGMDAV